jgi:hypothetical protein
MTLLLRLRLLLRAVSPHRLAIACRLAVRELRM